MCCNMGTDRYLRASTQAAEVRWSSLLRASDTLNVERRRAPVGRAGSDRLFDFTSYMECRDIAPFTLAPRKICYITDILIRK